MNLPQVPTELPILLIPLLLTTRDGSFLKSGISWEGGGDVARAGWFQEGLGQALQLATAEMTAGKVLFTPHGP